jgi:ribosome-binding factor A
LSQRIQRMADQIQREMADLIRNELKDPRLGMVTVSAVRVSKDMGYADVYVTVMGRTLDADTGESVAVLNHAAGFLRGELGRRLMVRMIPRLRFHYDEATLRGNRMSALINQAIAEDEAHHPAGNDNA